MLADSVWQSIEQWPFRIHYTVCQVYPVCKRQHVRLRLCIENRSVIPDLFNTIQHYDIEKLGIWPTNKAKKMVCIHVYTCNILWRLAHSHSWLNREAELHRCHGNPRWVWPWRAARHDAGASIWGDLCQHPRQLAAGRWHCWEWVEHRRNLRLLLSVAHRRHYTAIMKIFLNLSIFTQFINTSSKLAYHYNSL